MTTWRSDQAEALIEELGSFASVSDLAAHGLSKDVLTRLTGQGVLRRLCRGVYTAEATWAASDDASRHRLLLRAHQRRDPHQVATGLTAATVYSLPVPFQPPPAPQLTHRRGAPHRGARGGQNGALQRRAWLSDDEITVVDGLLVTTPARTVIDCARHLNDGWALALGDHAARWWGVTADEILWLLDRATPSPGHRRARWVARNLDQRAGCALESLARAVSIRLHLPALTPWATVGTGFSERRVPLLDRENGIVVWTDDSPKDESVQDVWRVRELQDHLRDLGLEVCRFSYEDYARPHSHLFRLRRAIARSRRRGFRQAI